MAVASRSRIMIEGWAMLAWLLSGDGECEEVEVDLHGVVLLPDDKLIRIIGLIDALVDCELDES